MALHRVHLVSIGLLLLGGVYQLRGLVSSSPSAQKEARLQDLELELQGRFAPGAAALKRATLNLPQLPLTRALELPSGSGPELRFATRIRWAHLPPDFTLELEDRDGKCYRCPGSWVQRGGRWYGEFQVTPPAAAAPRLAAQSIQSVRQPLWFRPSTLGLRRLGQRDLIHRDVVVVLPHEHVLPRPEPGHDHVTARTHPPGGHRH